MGKLISKRFPPDKYNRVLDIAGGQGYLSLNLMERGYVCKLVDSRKSGYSRKIRKRHRPCTDREVRKFSHDLYYTVDIVVGMHPDQATEEILRWATLNRKPFAVCPCCVMPTSFILRDPSMSKWKWWVGYLKSIVKNTHSVDEIYLKMKGKNLVLIGVPIDKE